MRSRWFTGTGVSAALSADDLARLCRFGLGPTAFLDEVFPRLVFSMMITYTKCNIDGK